MKKNQGLLTEKMRGRKCPKSISTFRRLKGIKYNQTVRKIELDKRVIQKYEVGAYIVRKRLTVWMGKAKVSIEYFGASEVCGETNKMDCNLWKVKNIEELNF